MRLISAVLFFLFATSELQAQTTINHDISSGNLVIQGTSTDNYIVTGSTSLYRIIVGSGYTGTITLSNVTIVSSGITAVAALCGNGLMTVGTGSCVAIMGQNRASELVPSPNLAPVTNVNIVLDGNNTLTYTSNDEYCAIQVDEGAQIHISAIDPNDNNSGTLEAKATTYIPGSGSISQAGAAIGACGTYAYNGTQGYTNLMGSGCYNGIRETTGGNIIISSGTILAWGGHAAGIGGAHYDYYNGIIIIYGGVVEARGNFDAAGIGSGCPEGTGVLQCYADVSTIVVLPPAKIEAYGAGLNSSGGVGTSQFSELGLAGMLNITYINDPHKTHITVHTEDTLPNAYIYLDLTQITGVQNAFNSAGLGSFNLAKVRVGRTDNTGMFSFHGEFQQSTTFFTDASSIKPATLGRPYMPEVRIITGTKTDSTTIILPLLTTNISFMDFPSTPLEEGYSSTQATQNAHCIKVSYNDAIPMTNVSFTLQDGIDFSSLIFLASDSTTVIAPPTTLTNGMVFYIVFPIDLGRLVGVYSDVLLIDGNYSGVPLPGYIRRIGMQRVVSNDSQNNLYIKVTASPNQFITTYPTTNTTTLTLNIDHTGTSTVYDHLDVVAKYLITTEPNYSLAIIADPLNTSNWKPLNIPLTNNTNTTTTVSFSTLPVGTYYIHWYVESGIVYAHSLSVVNPPALYGGFGKYMVGDTVTPGTISGVSGACSGATIILTGTASTGGSNSYTYTWQTSPNSSGPWTNLPSSNSQNYTTVVSTTAYYRRETLDAALGASYSNTIHVAVTPTVVPSMTITVLPN